MSNEDRDARKREYQEDHGNIKESSWCPECSRQTEQHRVGPMEWQCERCGEVQVKP